MYILTNDKLYIQDGGKVVGVEVDSHQLYLNGEIIELPNEIDYLLTPLEVKAKFQLLDLTINEKQGKEVVKKVGVTNDTTTKAKKPTKGTK